MRSNPTRQHTLSDQDIEIVRSFILPIQQNIPLADNMTAVTTVLLMLTCGMIEHAHFGTPMIQDASFESDEAGYGIRLFESIRGQADIETAAIAYLRYLTTGRTYDTLDDVPVDVRLTDEEIVPAPPKRPSVMDALRYLWWALTGRNKEQ